MANNIQQGGNSTEMLPQDNTDNEKEDPQQPSDAAGQSDTANKESKLRVLLKLYFYAAFNWKDRTISFHVIYCLIFLIQIVKVSLITDQMFRFGYERSNFSSVVIRGHLALRHLLLKDWTANWKPLPYPPAHGDFAVYTIDDLESSINFAVSGYYNAEYEATGYYVHVEDDNMTVAMKYFDFSGFRNRHVDGIDIYDTTFSTNAGLSKTIIGNETLYSYNITKELQYLNLSHHFQRMLSITLKFTLHSLRSHENSRLATCLQVKGEVIYKDVDHNGQVNVDLDTLTTRIKCEDMNLAIQDWQLGDDIIDVGNAVVSFCCISLVITSLVLTFGGYVFWKAKCMQKELQWHTSDYFRFLKFWDIFVILSDILTLYGTVFLAFKTKEKEWMLETLDSDTVWLGLGCVFAWLSLLRFFKFNIKFHLLFSTMYYAFWDVIAYLCCVIVLFIGFWVCGFVVIGPYNVKFGTLERAAETLFSMVNGDEIYATLESLESEKIGDKRVIWFSRFYIAVYVSVFTIVAINLLIALFINAYDTIKERNAKKKDERKLHRNLQEMDSDRNDFRSKLKEFLNNTAIENEEENKLKNEILSLINVNESNEKPETLKAFMEYKKHDNNNGGCFKVSCSEHIILPRIRMTCKKMSCKQRDNAVIV